MNNKVIYYTCFVLFSFVVSGCATNSLHRLSDIKYHYGSTGLSDRVRLDGYYIYHDNSSNTCDIAIFYEDGAFACFWDISDEIYNSLGFNLIKLAEKKEKYCVKEHNWKLSHGVYILNGNYIESNWHYLCYLFTPLFKIHWIINKDYWRIIDNETIEHVGGYGLVSYNNEYSYNRKEFDTIQSQTFKFIPMRNLPSSYSKYRKKSWMWESKEEMDMYFKDREKNEH